MKKRLSFDEVPAQHGLWLLLQPEAQRNLVDRAIVFFPKDVYVPLEVPAVFPFLATQFWEDPVLAAEW